MLYDPKWEKEISCSEPWREVLRHAATVIERRGLRTFGFGGTRNDNAPVCVMRALEIAVFELGSDIAAWSAPRDALMRYLGCDSIINWTDTPSRTKSDVITVLQAAAESR